MPVVSTHNRPIALLVPLAVMAATMLFQSGCGRPRAVVSVEVAIHVDIAALAEVSDQELLDQYRSDLHEYERANWFKALFMSIPQAPPTIAVPSPRTMLALCSDGVVLDAKPLAAIGHYEVVLKGVGRDPVLCFMAGSDSVAIAIRVVHQATYMIQIGPGVTVVNHGVGPADR